MKNVLDCKQDFPILNQFINDNRLVYFDSAASSQKPLQVIDAVKQFYLTDYANIHRGVHTLSIRATQAYEKARNKVQKFLNAKSSKEVIFVRGTTEAINLVAQSYGRAQFKQGDEIILSHMEHHSNIVPWQLICEQTGALLKVIPVSDEGELDIQAYQALLSQRTKLVAVTHISNTLGTINPIKEMIDLAHTVDVPVLIDGAQAGAHAQIDVQALDCDFYTLSGHKMYAPTGIGVLYGKAELLESMPPYQGGGDMIREVSFEKTTYNELPYKFEAGTPNIAGAIGLGAAIDYLSAVGLAEIARYENELLAYATHALQAIGGVKIIGTAENKSAVLSFLLEDIHPHDIGTILDGQGIAIRAGHHCTMPLMKRFGVPATARVSLAVYNSKEDIDALVQGLIKVKEIFSV